MAVSTSPHGALPRHKAPHRAWARPLAAAVAATVLLVGGGIAWWQAQDEPTTATPDLARPAAQGEDAAPPADGADPVPGPEVEVDVPGGAVAPMEAVALSGRAPGSEPGTGLVVQRRAPSGSWFTFPLPAVVDRDGRFRTYVELGESGTHQLRVVDPATGAASEAVTVTVR